MITYGDLRRWDAAQLATAGDVFRADLATLERARDTLETDTVPGSWDGLSKKAAEGRRDVLLSRMNAHLEEITDFERIVFAQQAVVARIVEDVAAIDTTAAQQQFEVGSTGTVTDVAPPREFTSIRVAEQYGEERVRLRDALVARVEGALDDAFAVDSALVQGRPACVFNDDEPSGVVDPQVEREWSQMSEAERRAAAEAMAEDLAEQLGIEDFEVVIEDLEDKNGDGKDDKPRTNSYGSWDNDDHVLRLDVNDLDDPSVVIDTIAHEMRHADQHQAVDDLNAPWFGQDEDIDLPPGATLDDVRDWDENFDDYIDSDPDFDAYWNQPVEVDARDFGGDYLDDYDVDDLDEHREG
ncbi:hypothetical protein [Nocardioides alkalitolerans]|uniref:hypothetical protein n=1 Tax=Nocardioides alkalitolerans TaxID=281714 RepID=UPI0012F8026B|nr:hypothetical protein [Nocardioides alkalitolerans]